tara:strand:- start:184 stop:699 length:516 start_codon:yes stop_codon:yes gene_type:complete
MWIDIIRNIEDRRKNGNDLSYLNTNIDSHLGYYIMQLVSHIFDFNLVENNIKIHDTVHNTNREHSFLLFYLQTQLLRELTLEKNNSEREYQGVINNIQYITSVNNINNNTNIMDSNININNDINRLNELLSINKAHIKNINNLIKLINNKFRDRRSIVNLIESIRDIKKYL